MPQLHDKIPTEKVDEAYAIGIRFSSRIETIFTRQSGGRPPDPEICEEARREALELIDGMVRLAGPPKKVGLSQ